jgi:hypothetical protein
MSITTAIENLPEELITSEIVNAALKEGEIKLLNYLPEKYMTADNIELLVANDKSYWGHFDLERIPINCRNQAVCNCALKRHKDNYRHVPDELKTIPMLDEIMSGVKEKMYLLKFVPCDNWNDQSVYKGIYALYRENSTDYSSRGKKHYYNYSSDIGSKMRLIQVLLSFVPKAIKNKKFYHGLFVQTNLSAEDMQFLVPNKHKDDSYYYLLAQKDFDLVPKERYSHRIFLEALKHDKNFSIRTLFEEGLLHDQFIALLDDELADAVVMRNPAYFNSLPRPLQTPERVLFIFEHNPAYDRYESLIKDKDEKLLTKTVCKTLVKRNTTLPVFPDKIWNQDFVDFCMKNPGSFTWFRQMPQQFQTQEMVNQAVDFWASYIEYVHPSFINSYLAMKMYRHNSDLKKHLPEKYFTDFVTQTGLPEEFFGGECSFMELKEKKKEYTYCQTGNDYIGFYTDGRYTNSTPYIIMTRASSHSEQPEIVFNSRIGSFHKTWLEKQIADFDREFVKPTVGKEFREFQLSPYCGVETAGMKDGISFYRNTFRCETIAFVAKMEETIYSGETREEVIVQFQRSKEQLKAA